MKHTISLQYFYTFSSPYQYKIGWVRLHTRTKLKDIIIVNDVLYVASAVPVSVVIVAVVIIISWDDRDLASAP